MLFNIRGNKIEITEPINAYIDKKIGRLDKYFGNPENLRANVLVRISGIDQIVEVTIPIKKGVLRAEDRDKDLYAAIDKVTEKLERQIRKNKSKIKKNRNSKNSFIEINVDEIPDDDLKETSIVKRKVIETKPMSEEEAILQMELVGHEFYVFKNSKDNNVSVVYKRSDGDYGIIDIK